MEDYDILIGEDGDVSFVYSDDLAEVFAGEEQVTVRASHVEPHPRGDGWLSDMRPSFGPVIGANGEFIVPRHYPGTEDILLLEAGKIRGFATRAEALAAEREWLRREKGL